MEEYIGLDVSLKDTAISVRRNGKRVWRGKCASDPQLLAAVNGGVKTGHGAEQKSATVARMRPPVRGGNQGEIRIASPKSVPRELCRCLTRMFSNASRVVTIVFPHLVRVTEVAKPLASAPSIAP